MQMENCAPEEIMLQVGGEPRKALIWTPKRLALRPALLINFGLDRQQTLGGDSGRIRPDVFLAAGHRVASIELPNHGERANEYGEGLPGMANSVAHGVDVFADIRETGRALIQSCLDRGLVQDKRVFLSGVSRNGHAALHVMAAEEQVLACAILSPVTHLPTLWEFRDLADNPIVRRSNAAALVDRLADRPVFIAMGTSDPRVGADRCFDFHARLCAASRRTLPELFCAEGQSHGTTYPEETGNHAGAAFLLRQYAMHMKEAVQD